MLLIVLLPLIPSLQHLHAVLCALVSEASDVPLQCHTIGNNSDTPTNINIDVDLPDSNPPINTTLQPNENIIMKHIKKYLKQKRSKERHIF